MGTAARPATAIMRGMRLMGGSPIGDDMRQVLGAPYSGAGTTETITRFADGNRIVQKSTTHYFRDGQGRVRTERAMNIGAQARTGSPLPEPRFVAINDPITGERLMLNATMKKAHVMPSFPSAPVQSPVEVPPPIPHLVVPGVMIGMGPDNLSDPTELGEKEIEGVRVVGSRVEQTVPAGQMDNEKPITTTIEQWFSPELGVTVQMSQRSSIGTEINYRLENIVRGEPDSSLFAMPADYTRDESSGAQGVFQSIPVGPLLNSNPKSK